MLTCFAAIINSVAIIGAGPSGLVAAKEAKECGLTPTVFEQDSTIGGIWKPDEGKTWDSMKVNNVRHAVSFSDYEWNDNANDYPNQKDVYNYLCTYAETFDINNCVQLNSQVTQVVRVNNKWSVEWINGHNESLSAMFDSVIVSSGVFTRAFTPEILGLETFTGSVIHAQDYKRPNPFEGKTVAVIGNAFSGCEIASDVTQTASKVFHIFSRPKWITSRYVKEKTSNRTLPSDLALFNRNILTKYKGLSRSECNELVNNICNALCTKQAKVCEELTILVPSSDPAFIAISDSYLRQIENGSIIPKKSSITSLQGNTLYLSDGSSVTVDCLIFCTGYHADIPFFTTDMQEQLNFQAEDPVQPFVLYKTVFHPEFPNMAFVGMARFPIYFGVVELQARLACMTFSGKIPLPTKEVMVEGVQAELALRSLLPRPQLVRGYMGFCDDLAKQIGVLPDFIQLQKEDPVLYDKLWNGPFTTASYRLIGFGSNRDLAMKRIDELVEYVGAPLLDPEYVYY